MAMPRKAARKTMREAFPAATALRENLELMMIRNHDSRNKLAEVLGVDVATLRRRLDDPTKFTLGDLEAMALWWDVSVSALTQPARLVEDEPILRERAEG